MKVWRIVVWLVVGMVCLSPLASEAGRFRGTPSVLVVPARYTVVQYAFDVAQMRPVYLVSYDVGTADEPLLLHAWSREQRAWEAITLDQYEEGIPFRKSPARVFVVGSEATLPRELVSRATWADEVVLVPTLQVAEMANTMSETLHFSASDWKWLGRRHGLELKDLNRDRRRYGRYGKPGEKAERSGMVFGGVAPVSTPTPSPAEAEDTAAEDVEEAAAEPAEHFEKLVIEEARDAQDDPADDADPLPALSDSAPIESLDK